MTKECYYKHDIIIVLPYADTTYIFYFMFFTSNLNSKVCNVPYILCFKSNSTKLNKHKLCLNENLNRMCLYAYLRCL